MTFVGTSHNPQTILGARKGEKIQVLRRSFDDPGRVEVCPLDVPEGRRADQVLTGGWFGLDSTLDEQTLDLLSRHQRLLLEGRKPEDEDVRALEEEIRSRIHRFVDTARESYAYGIVSEILRDELPKLGPEEREAARQRLKAMAKDRLAARESNKA